MPGTLRARQQEGGAFHYQPRRTKRVAQERWRRWWMQHSLSLQWRIWVGVSHLFQEDPFPSHTHELSFSGQATMKTNIIEFPTYPGHIYQTDPAKYNLTRAFD